VAMVHRRPQTQVSVARAVQDESRDLSCTYPLHASYDKRKLILLQVLQGVLVGIALVATVLRCWIRLRLERRKLTLPDYIVWGAFLLTLAWFVCSAIGLHLEMHHPLTEENRYMTDSVPYLVVCVVGDSFWRSD
jgi:hypothetical protein